MNVISTIWNRVIRSVSSAASQWGQEYSYDILPPGELRAAATVPFVRRAMVQFSRDEYERNPYYKSVIDNLAGHTIGPTPTIMGLSRTASFNDVVEDAYLDWSSSNGIGKVFRELRREAALTGLSIAVPYKKQDSLNPVSHSYKIYGKDALETPQSATIEDRIIDGIEYDEEWSVVKFHFKSDDPMQDGPEYTVQEVLWWTAGYRNGMINPMPECYAAFTIYPYIRRFLQAVIEGEELRVSMPMAVELDAKIYSPANRNDPPTGMFQYEPKMIPTLPVGASLKGVPQSGSSSSDKDTLVRLMASTCALCVQMPANLAVGDSSNSNMASAQVDIQPWKNKVNIDRFDMEPVFRKSFAEWWRIAVRKEGLLPSAIRKPHLLYFPHTYIYDNLFQHPDPVKNANARAIDLISGSTTLQRIYSELGKNPRRELEAEARLLGIDMDELARMILSARTTKALEILGELDANEDRRTSQSGTG